MAQYGQHVVLLVLGAAWIISGCPAGAEQRTATVTNGTVYTSGWQSNLVQRNRNLAHFTWLPMISYTRGQKKITLPPPPKYLPVAPPQGKYYGRAAQGVAEKKVSSIPTRVSRFEIETQQREPIYIKPIHISTFLKTKTRHPSNFSSTGAGWRKPFYIKPIAVAPGYQCSGQMSTSKAVPQLAFGKLQGNLRLNTGTGQLASKQVMGSLRTSNLTGSLVHKDGSAIFKAKQNGVLGRRELLQTPEVSVYADAYGSLSTSQSCQQMYGSISDQKVYGQILPSGRGYRCF